ncbi:MAG: hypothetical protein OEX04_10450 [Acidimicrobiia bacterium]|nr:hypothetical protein [Acidimicrobiia bacterium]MDH4307889.1 hypothetical protein [Acidimicrobiia bacterium]
MGTYMGDLTMSGVVTEPLDICMDLNRGFLAMRTSGGEEIGAWHLDTVQILGRQDDGFMFKINGVPGRVRTDNDGAFATEIDLIPAPPRLKRLMAENRPALSPAEWFACVIRVVRSWGLRAVRLGSLL